jgi:hypothetical protein
LGLITKSPILHFTTSALNIADGLILLLAFNLVLSPAQKEERSAPPSEEVLLNCRSSFSLLYERSNQK